MSGYDEALTQLGGWPAERAGAAVVGPGGVLARFGSTDEPFELASVTKPLSALATLIAIEEGALELTDPIDPGGLPGATLEQLLAHAAGLAPDQRTRLFPPANRRVYSNAGYELLGEVVAAAVTMPFADYFDAALVRRLHLKATTLAGSPARAGRASVDDLAIVMAELLTPSRLLHPATVADATTAHFPGLRGVLPGFGAQDPNDWGLGFEIRGHKQPHWTGALNAPSTFGHFGQSGTMFWIDPRAGLGLVALSNEPFGPWAAQAWPALSDAVLSIDPA